jgi:REP element-mobilizing transposase RayT
MSEDKYKNKYRIPTNRLQGYDYGSNGCYFVTICTQNRVHYFGEIVNESIIGAQCNVETRLIASLQATEIGKIAEQFWLDIPNHFPFVILDQYAIMPNHIHGILIFNKNDDIQCCRDAINRVSTNANVNTNDATDIISNTKKTGGITGIHNPMLHINLGRVIRWFKGRVSFECRSFSDFAWQERFHDSIIYNNIGLCNVRKYIYNNPKDWEKDELNDKYK